MNLLWEALGLLWFGCSINIISSSTDASAKFPSSQAELGRQWNSWNQSQPSPGFRADESPCITILPAFLYSRNLVVMTHYWDTLYPRLLGSQSGRGIGHDRKLRERSENGPSRSELFQAFSAFFRTFGLDVLRQCGLRQHIRAVQPPGKCSTVPSLISIWFKCFNFPQLLKHWGGDVPFCLNLHLNLQSLGVQNGYLWHSSL